MFHNNIPPRIRLFFHLNIIDLFSIRTTTVLNIMHHIRFIDSTSVVVDRLVAAITIFLVDTVQ